MRLLCPLRNPVISCDLRLLAVFLPQEGPGRTGAGSSRRVPLAAVCILAPYAFGLFLLLLTGFVLLIIAAWHDWFGIGRRKSVGSIVLGAAALSAAVLLYAYRSDFISRRLACALHPELDPAGAGYQASAIRKALGASQWLGEGTWSASLPFDQSLPGCDSDAFLTTLIYKLGWLPFAVAFCFGPSVMKGSVKTQQYQWFVSSKQGALSNQIISYNRKHPPPFCLFPRNQTVP